MSRLSKFHPSVYFDKMDKYDKKVYLDEYNNKSMKRKISLKDSYRIWDDVDVLF